MSLISLEKSKNLPPTRSPSSVWEHYEKIFDDKDIFIHIACKYCNQKYSLKSSTTTLKDYWKKKHYKNVSGILNY